MPFLMPAAVFASEGHDGRLNYDKVSVEMSCNQYNVPYTNVFVLSSRCTFVSQNINKQLRHQNKPTNFPYGQE